MPHIFAYDSHELAWLRVEREGLQCSKRAILKSSNPCSACKRRGGCSRKPSHLESVEAGRPPGAPPDWQPGAVLRLPFSQRICRDGGVVCGQALTALADSAMMIACAAACNGYTPMAPIDQTIHFLRPVNFDVVADGRVVRIGRATTFGRVMLYSAVDKRPVGMAASAYAMLWATPASAPVRSRFPSLFGESKLPA